MKNYLPIGKIINTHGVKGEMKMDVWCDSMNALDKVDTVYTDDLGNAAFKVVSKRAHGKFLLIMLEGIDSLESALRYKSKELYVLRDLIPKSEGSYFITDLIGLCVFNSDTDEKIGEVFDIYNRGASDIIEIKREEKNNALVPFVNEFVKRIDLDTGIYIKPVEGLFD